MADFRVVVLGDGAVGKSATSIQLCRNHFVDAYDPTIEDSYRHTLVVNEEAIMVEIQDTAGQEGFSTLLDKWLRWGNGFVVIYSITSRNSFNRINFFVDRIREVIEQDVFPLVIVGNKSDLEDKREVSVEEGRVLSQKWTCTQLEASAKLRRNIEDIFIDICRQIKDPSKNIAARPHPIGNFEDQKIVKKKKKPCILM
eukprot:TRINITY_DN1182_c0_g2_i1.p1 TRINITY_DN1182_c0_g2~~TRINITY_DN1182_c0_g2_i1.p1  ORF type:complete len:198 (-),score=71.12 TRINITY_DN1182_c0_g2_i1:86-679(-)